jgi:hypothetical protein
MEWNAFKEFGAVDVTAGFAVSEAGIYPLRLLSGQGTGAASLEWFSILPDGTKVLINDTRIRTRCGHSARARPLRHRSSPPPRWWVVKCGLRGLGPALYRKHAAITGPWTTAASQTNPQNVTPTGTMKFYRIRNP